MPLFPSRYFGTIDSEQPNEWYESEQKLNGSNVEIALAIPKGAKEVTLQTIQVIDQYIDQLPIHEKAIRQRIRKDFQEKGETNTYLEIQIEYLEKEDIDMLIDGIEKKVTRKQKLLSVLHPIFMIFYPEEEDPMFAVLDYTISKDLTDDLLAIKIYKDNHIRIDIES